MSSLIGQLFVSILIDISYASVNYYLRYIISVIAHYNLIYRTFWAMQNPRCTQNSPQSPPVLYIMMISPKQCLTIVHYWMMLTVVGRW